MRLTQGRPPSNPLENEAAEDRLFALVEAQEEYEIAKAGRRAAAHAALNTGARIEDIAKAMKLSYSGARVALGLVKRRNGASA